MIFFRMIPGVKSFLELKKKQVFLARSTWVLVVLEYFALIFSIQDRGGWPDGHVFSIEFSKTFNNRIQFLPSLPRPEN